MSTHVAARPLRIGVIGAGEATDRAAELAYSVGSEIAKREAITLCGGLGGVMASAAAGANDAGGLVVGLLPGTEAGAAAEGVTIPLATGVGEARNAILARSSEAVIAISGEWGTLSEAAFCRKFGVPVIGLEASLPDGVENESASSPEEAVARAIELARTKRGTG